MPPLNLELSLEQQFNLRAYEGMVQGLSAEQAREMLLDVLQQLMIKDNVIKNLLKSDGGWGL